MVHVHFFGDKGRHSWINSPLMIILETPDSFNRLLQELPKTSTSDRKAVMTPAKNRKLEIGISEAETIVNKPPKLRLEAYFQLYPSAKPQSTETRKVGDRSKPCNSPSGEVEIQCAKGRVSCAKSNERPENIIPDDVIVKTESPTEKKSPRVFRNGRLGLIGSLADRIALRKTALPKRLKPKRQSIIDYSDVESDYAPPSTVTESTGSVTSSVSLSDLKPRKLLKLFTDKETRSESVTSRGSGSIKASRLVSKHKLHSNSKVKAAKRSKVRSDSMYNSSETSKTDVNGNLAAKLMKKVKRMCKKLGPGFEEYRDKLLDRISEENAELSSDEVERYLQNTWLEMTDAQKAK